MMGSQIDTFVFAPLAPILGLLLFWFIQLLFIESQRYILSKIWHKHEPLCRFTNFLGILYQTICHALGYTVTRSGISDFFISVDYGKVAPKKEKKGVFEWVSNAFLFIGPFFIPSLLLLIYFILIINPSAFSFTTGYYESFSSGLQNFGTNLYSFSEKFFAFLFNIDFLNPVHFGFFILLIIVGLGIRPSYIGETKKEKIDMLYDLRNIKNLLIGKPLYLVFLFVIAYIIFYISFFLEHGWYIALFSFLGWLSTIAIISLIITQAIVFLIKNTDELQRPWSFLPYLAIPVSYLTMRTTFFFYQLNMSNSVSLMVMILSTVLITFLLLKYKTNRFKTKKDIKKAEEEDDKKEKRKRRRDTKE
ncbi:MAG: hypothetical protein QHH19_04910 [Candidatus Thermoplasmatota archaeon]|jgi:hypothetical protein|nr:hypothetical protein [Candidatus Thermoplasmatota archaeon]